MLDYKKKIDVKCGLQKTEAQTTQKCLAWIIVIYIAFKIWQRRFLKGQHYI